jgi:hypothetical protein
MPSYKRSLSKYELKNSEDGSTAKFRNDSYLKYTLDGGQTQT